MRLVLDTNTVISGLLWHGAPGKLADPHLLDLKSLHGISIVGATEALERIARR